MENTQELIKIDFNETMVGRGKPPQYANGFYQGAITKAEQSVAKGSKNLQLILTMNAIDEAGVVQDITVRHFVGLPIPNPKEAGHKPFKDDKQRNAMYRRARELIRTIEGSSFLPAFPTWDKETKVNYYPGTTDVMPVAEARALTNEIDAKTLQQLLVYWNDPTILEGKELYFATKLNDQGWANVHYIRSDVGEGTVSYSDFAA